MTRTLSPALGTIVESLEMAQPQIVTMQQVRDLVERHGIRTDPKLVALRLRSSRRVRMLARTGMALPPAPSARTVPAHEVPA